MNRSSALNHIKAFVPALAWAGVIFFLSSQEMLPGLTLSAPDFILKKTGHVLVYAVLYLLVLDGFNKIGKPPHQSWHIAAIICLLYAISDEIHQSTVPGRTATARDVGFDMLGISLAFLFKFNYI